MLETNQTFNEIFSRLKSIMISYEGELEVKKILFKLKGESNGKIK